MKYNLFFPVLLFIDTLWRLRKFYLYYLSSDWLTFVICIVLLLSEEKSYKTFLLINISPSSNSENKSSSVLFSGTYFIKEDDSLFESLKNYLNIYYEPDNSSHF